MSYDDNDFQFDGSDIDVVAEKPKINQSNVKSKDNQQTVAQAKDKHDDTDQYFQEFEQEEVVTKSSVIKNGSTVPHAKQSNYNQKKALPQSNDEDNYEEDFQEEEETHQGTKQTASLNGYLSKDEEAKKSPFNHKFSNQSSIQADYNDDFDEYNEIESSQFSDNKQKQKQKQTSTQNNKKNDRYINDQIKMNEEEFQNSPQYHQQAVSEARIININERLRGKSIKEEKQIVKQSQVNTSISSQKDLEKQVFNPYGSITHVQKSKLDPFNNKNYEEFTDRILELTAQQDLTGYSINKIIKENEIIRSELQQINDKLQEHLDKQNQKTLKRRANNMNSPQRQVLVSEIHNNQIVLDTLLKQQQRLNDRKQLISDPDYAIELEHQCKQIQKAIDTTQKVNQENSVDLRRKDINISHVEKMIQKGELQRDLDHLQTHVINLQKQNSQLKQQAGITEQQLEKLSERDFDVQEKYEKVLQVADYYQINSETSLTIDRNTDKYRYLKQQFETLKNSAEIQIKNLEAREKGLQQDVEERRGFLQARKQQIFDIEDEIEKMNLEMRLMFKRQHLSSQTLNEVWKQIKVPGMQKFESNQSFNQDDQDEQRTYLLERTPNNQKSNSNQLIQNGKKTTPNLQQQGKVNSTNIDFDAYEDHPEKDKRFLQQDMFVDENMIRKKNSSFFDDIAQKYNHINQQADDSPDIKKKKKDTLKDNEDQISSLPSQNPIFASYEDIQDVQIVRFQQDDEVQPNENGFKDLKQSEVKQSQVEKKNSEKINSDQIVTQKDQHDEQPKEEERPSPETQQQSEIQKTDNKQIDQQEQTNSSSAGGNNKFQFKFKKNPATDTNTTESANLNGTSNTNNVHLNNLESNNVNNSNDQNKKKQQSIEQKFGDQKLVEPQTQDINNSSLSKEKVDEKKEQEIPVYNFNSRVGQMRRAGNNSSTGNDPISNQNDQMQLNEENTKSPQKIQVQESNQQKEIKQSFGQPQEQVLTQITSIIQEDQKPTENINNQDQIPVAGQRNRRFLQQPNNQNNGGYVFGSDNKNSQQKEEKKTSSRDIFGNNNSDNSKIQAQDFGQIPEIGENKQPVIEQDREDLGNQKKLEPQFNSLEEEANDSLGFLKDNSHQKQIVNYDQDDDDIFGNQNQKETNNSFNMNEEENNNGRSRNRMQLNSNKLDKQQQNIDEIAQKAEQNDFFGDQDV